MHREGAAAVQQSEELAVAEAKGVAAAVHEWEAAEAEASREALAAQEWAELVVAEAAPWRPAAVVWVSAI